MREYSLVLLTSFATTYLLAGLCRRLALRTGAVAKVRDRDVHAVPIPYFGGIAMYGGLVAAYEVGAASIAGGVPDRSRSASGRVPSSAAR